MRVIRVIVLIALLVAAGAAVAWYALELPIVLTQPVTVTIARGDKTPQIARKLDEAGLLHSPRVFTWLARWRRIDRHLRPGRYQFSDTVSLSGLLDQLHDGRAVIISVTIPEGWTESHILAYLESELGLNADSVAAFIHDSAFVANWAPGSPGLEGYFWPETYQFYWGAEPNTVLTELLDKSRRSFTDSLEQRAAQLGMTRHQVLTLASLIEAEAAQGSERSRIAGVFHNRLRSGWLLQCDPTVAYAMGGLPPGRLLTHNDLAFESPYNTYLHPGLPPGPICNPGPASVHAALYPDSTDAMYFVADGSGAHIFSRSLDEHNRAIAKILRKLPHR
jgi:UPF0755 protein